MRPVPAAALAMALLAGLTPAPAAAQNPRPANRASAPEQPPPAAVRPNTNWGETQGQLFQVLQQYPPTLGQVLRLDPTLLTNQAYLEPYPALAAFLNQHPEIAHNP